MSQPDPYAALKRILSLRPAQRRPLLRLEVWCEESKCTPIRVFQLREGLLVQCRSDADVRDMQETYDHLKDWSRRRAFFAEEWLAQPEETLAISHLQVVCDCLQTTARPVDMRKLIQELPSDGETVRRVRIPAVAADVR